MNHVSNVISPVKKGIDAINTASDIVDDFYELLESPLFKQFGLTAGDLEGYEYIGTILRITIDPSTTIFIRPSNNANSPVEFAIIESTEIEWELQDVYWKRPDQANQLLVGDKYFPLQTLVEGAGSVLNKFELFRQSLNLYRASQLARIWICCSQ